MLSPNAARDLTGGHMFRLWMPYCYELQRPIDLRHVYLPLNRDYRPLGIASGEGFHRDAYRPQAVLFWQDPHAFDEVWWSEDADRLWLYNDLPESRADYFERLERLMSKRQMTVGNYEERANMAALFGDEID